MALVSPKLLIQTQLPRPGQEGHFTGVNPHKAQISIRIRNEDVPTQVDNALRARHWCHKLGSIHILANLWDHKIWDEIRVQSLSASQGLPDQIHPK